MHYKFNAVCALGGYLFARRKTYPQGTSARRPPGGRNATEKHAGFPFRRVREEALRPPSMALCLNIAHNQVRPRKEIPLRALNQYLMQKPNRKLLKKKEIMSIVFGLFQNPKSLQQRDEFDSGFWHKT